MNYTSLKTNISDICEQSFTDDQLALFVQQAEQKIYNTVDLPAMRASSTTAMTASQNTYTFPSDLLYVYSFAVVTGGNTYSFLLNKDESFMLDAYPNTSTEGQPKHYGFYSQTQFLLGPTPDANYAVQLNYGAYPESIVTAGTTFLGNEYDDALLNGALVEAQRFLQAEEKELKNYEKMYVQSIALLKNAVDGRMKRDAYRSGLPRRPVA